MSVEDEEYMQGARRESALTLAVKYVSTLPNQSFSAAGICRVADVFLGWLAGDSDKD